MGTGAGQSQSGAGKTTLSPAVQGQPLNAVAVWITERVGSMVFFLIIFCWTAIWLLWNMLAPKSLRFDPYPGFVLWLFISNMIQLLLIPLIMVGQNLLSRSSDLRTKRDFDVNRKAEREIQEIQEQLKVILARLDEMKAAGTKTARGR